ncbi:sensor histidine kinase [Oribacterium sp. WCC10]|uniref:sensor histidine kinase n=1 Tax=Oribacterium sp. WCC10 TaxID=1855343 RepID=UPI0008ED8B0B|nr:sensor histidine kinase [Oribacterium sp. WCC10]SFG26315.1 GHKL domain-containing protein [Oribacterium sp. WCC10]
MNVPRLLFAVLNAYPMLTAVVMCIIPLRHQRRGNRITTFLVVIAFLLTLFSVTSYLLIQHSIFYNRYIPLILFPSFYAYDRAYRADLSKKAYIFIFSCAVASFMVNMSYGYDAIIHPASDWNHFSHEATVFQFVICTFITLLLSFPLSRFGAELVDGFDSDVTWYLAGVLASFFLITTLLIVPKHYETLHVNNMMMAYWVVIIMMFLLMLILFMIFYFIVMSSVQASQIRIKNRYLEMQEQEYRKLKDYMEATRRQRHDFRQTIRTLLIMSNVGTMESIKAYLTHYLDSEPSYAVTNFTPNLAVNAVLNYYMNSAKENNIRLNWQVDLDKDIPWITDSELCTVVGNILDNAIIACSAHNDAPPEVAPFIDLSLRSENGKTIYIMVTNSYTEANNKKAAHNTPNNSNEHGIGLLSIKNTAENYSGTANFYHEDSEFYSEVMLRAPE